jgi:hypothetical protein
LTPVVTGLSVSSGSAGSTITITGQNFSGAAGHLSVFFGSTAASSVAFVNDTTITAVVPNGSGTVHVTVQSGVNLIDDYSSNPNANVTAPIFGYGTSQTSTADQFTFLTGSPTTHFSVSAPASTGAGSSFNVTVTALDATNHTATGFSGTVHFTSSDGQAVLPANRTLTNGVRTFSFTLKSAGTQTLTATDTVTTSINGTSAPITVNPAAASRLVVSAPGNATAGSAFNFTVTAQDAFNNTATGYSGTIHFTSNDGAATLPGNSTLTNGTGTFSATLKTSGNRTLTATDTVTSSITGSSAAIAVSAAAATHFSVNAPGNATAGVSFNFTVTAQDAFNNTATGYGGTVHFTSSDGAATLAANSTLTNGIGSFSATLKTAGNRTLTATDTVTSSITGSSAAIVVGAAAATHFSVGAPVTATAGTPFNFTVTAQDAFNNTAISYSGTVHFTSNDGAATLPADSNLTNGIGTFSAALKTAGNRTLTATDTVSSSINGSATIAVNAGTATRFSLVAPGTATAGTSFNLSVTALDAFNNTATGYPGTVHVTSGDNQALLPPDATLTNGTATFAVTLKTAGNQRLTATDTNSNTITGVSGNVAVSPAAADHLAFGVQPIATAPGSAISPAPTVRILDQYNNLISNNGTQVTVTIASGPGGFSGTSTTTVTASGGIATFSNLVLFTTGTYTLGDIATGGLTGPSSNSFQVQVLQVVSFTPTSTGFSAQFNRPFNPAVLNLYDTQAGTFGPPDVTVVGSITGAIRGSLVIDPSNTVVTFIRTGSPLPVDAYTVTLRSASNGFVGLDGNGDGTTGDNYVSTFTVAASTAVSVSVPDITRGPGQNVNVPVNGGNGIPITLSDGSGVTAVQLTLQYDPTLLTVTGATVNVALPGATLTLDPSSTPGNAVFVFNTPALGSGAVSLGQVVAQVPSSAPYKSKEVLHLANLQVNGGAIAAINDDGLQVVAYLGDSSADGLYTAADSALTARVAVGMDSGFAAYRMTDPVVIADINRNGRCDSGDASILLQVAAGNISAFITPIPTPTPPIVPTGPDPTLSLAAGPSASAGQPLTVSVNIDDPMPEGSTGLSAATLALTFDPSVLTVTSADIHLGSVPESGNGWTLNALINPITGQIAITLYSTTPIQTSDGGSLVTIDFHVRSDASPGVTPISVVPEVNPTGSQVFRTGLSDPQGLLSLTFGPSDSLDDTSLVSDVTVKG